MVDFLKLHDYGDGPFPEVPDEIFAEIGCRLMLLQNLEMMLTFVSKVIFEENSQKAKESILKVDKKTMGGLITFLRKKMYISKDFDIVLKRTLEARNLFVHEFSNVYNLMSPDGINDAVKFLLTTMNDIEEVTNVLKAVIIQANRDKGISDKKLEYNWRKYGDLNVLESVYLPKASNLFSKK